MLGYLGSFSSKAPQFTNQEVRNRLRYCNTSSQKKRFDTWNKVLFLFFLVESFLDWTRNRHRKTIRRGEKTYTQDTFGNICLKRLTRETEVGNPIWHLHQSTHFDDNPHPVLHLFLDRFVELAICQQPFGFIPTWGPLRPPETPKP